MSDSTKSTGAPVSHLSDEENRSVATDAIQDGDAQKVNNKKKLSKVSTTKTKPAQKVSAMMIPNVHLVTKNGHHWNQKVLL